MPAWIALFALTALVVPAPAAPTPDVVVRGQPGRDARAASLLRQVMPVDANRPLVRFAEPVCLAVAGLPLAAARAVADRFLQDAQAAGLRLAGDGCRPNARIALLQPGAFAAAHRRDMADGAAATDPAIVRGTVTVRSRDGDMIQGDPRLFGFGATSLPQLGGLFALKLTRASRIGLPIRYDLNEAAIALPTAAAANKTPVQLADYAAMRLLAGANDPPPTAEPTTLALFAGPAAPGLTAFDRTLLAALYAGPPDEPAVETLARARHHLRQPSPDDRPGGG